LNVNRYSFRKWEVNTPLSKAIPIYIQAKDENIKATLIENEDYIHKSICVSIVKSLGLQNL
jgi:hypothetical protein